MNYEDKRPVIQKKACDVVVVGGGIAGVAAAVAAARKGVSVLLLEKSIVLGGLATAGLISWYEPLCDGCGKCESTCPGKAIDESGVDSWQCSVYYRGAHRSNPFMPENFLEGHPEREAILSGEARFDSESALEIYPELNFLPKTHFGYLACLCGKACEVACYKHLKEVGKI